MIEPRSIEWKNESLRQSPPDYPVEGATRGCPNCGGHGYYYAERGGTQYVKYCECLLSSGERLSQVGIPDEYIHCSFDGYKPQNDKQSYALETARGWVNRYPEVRKGLLFFGGYGTGKTHLAASITNILASKAVNIVFTPVPDFLRALKTEMDTGERTAMDEAKNAQVLVLDDIGIERSTPWAGDVITELLSYRYNGGLITIGTTNVQPGADLADAVTERIASRLAQMCLMVPVTGQDWRRKR